MERFCGKKYLFIDFLQEEKDNELSGMDQAALNKIEAGNHTATPDDIKWIKQAFEEAFESLNLCVCVCV